jgi:hypothetical protein
MSRLIPLRQSLAAILRRNSFRVVIRWPFVPQKPRKIGLRITREPNDPKLFVDSSISMHNFAATKLSSMTSAVAHYRHLPIFRFKNPALAGSNEREHELSALFRRQPNMHPIDTDDAQRGLTAEAVAVH